VRRGPLYLHVSAYITQNRRAIRPTLRLGFYARRTIYPAFPLILSRHDDVDVSPDGAGRLLLSIEPAQQELGAVVQGALDYGWGEVDLPSSCLRHRMMSARSLAQRFTTAG
jgi:hypothetical protein